MIIRTENGYKLNSWECCPTRLPNGAKLTPGESRAVVCRINGLSHKEAAEEMHVSKSSINQYWQTLYYKLHTSSAMTAISKLMELDALKRTALLMALVTFFSASFDLQEFERATRKPPRNIRTSRVLRNGRRSGAALMGDNAFTFLDDITNGNARDLYSISDLQGLA